MSGKVFDKSISVICVYNKPDVLERVLKDSLKKQTVNAELIALDNTKAKYSSAAAALNYGASISQGDILIFAHQDVSFDSPNALYELTENFKKCASIGDIGGVVGSAFSDTGIPKIVAGCKANFLGEKVGRKGFQSGFSQAETVDEFLIVMYKSTFLIHPFDEQLCDGWHFYAVEQCLNAKVNGKKVFVINADIRHISPGYIDSKFYWAQYKIAKKYQNIDHIIGTCCNFEPQPLYKLWIKAVKVTAKQKLKEWNIL